MPAAGSVQSTSRHHGENPCVDALEVAANEAGVGLRAIERDGAIHAHSLQPRMRLAFRQRKPTHQQHIGWLRRMSAK